MVSPQLYLLLHLFHCLFFLLCMQCLVVWVCSDHNALINSSQEVVHENNEHLQDCSMRHTFPIHPGSRGERCGMCDGVIRGGGTGLARWTAVVAIGFTPSHKIFQPISCNLHLTPESLHCPTYRPSPAHTGSLMFYFVL